MKKWCLTHYIRIPEDCTCPFCDFDIDLNLSSKKIIDQISNEELLILKQINKNIRDKKYEKLNNAQSQIIHSFYRNRLKLPETGDDETQFYTLSGYHIATGYKRVVLGDYGPYIEFAPEQINHSFIQNKFKGEPTRPVKYIWKETLDGKVKIYEQKATVTYADYIPGMYYISPADLKTYQITILYEESKI